MSKLIEGRRPPVQAVFAQHLPKKQGKCPWCGEPILERTPSGRPKTIHDACSFEMSVITSPAFAREAVFKRDRGICEDCKADCSEHAILRPRYPVGHTWHVAWIDDRGNSARAHQGYPYVPLVSVSLWHVDHNTPLWKTRHMPDLERIEYFKLAALKTRCDDCHQVKTSDEAMDRAHFRKLNNENKPKQSRGFSKRSDFKSRPPRDINEDLT